MTSELETQLTDGIDLVKHRNELALPQRFTPWHQKADIHGLFRGLSESESESETAIQEFTDKLSLIETTMSFVGANERRQIFFGKF